MKKITFTLLTFMLITSISIAQLEPTPIANNIYEWDGRLGIGTNFPGSKLQIVADQYIAYPSEGIFSLKNNHYASVNGYTYCDQYFVGSMFNGTRARGTIDFPKNVMEGDRITGLISAVYYDNDYHSNGAISIYTGVGLATGSYPSHIVFNTTNIGDDYYSEKMRLTENGFLGIGTTTPVAKVTVADGDIYIQDIEHGIIMKSPDGRCWKGLINNRGQVDFSTCSCPEIATPPSNEIIDDNSASIFPNPAGTSTTIEILDPNVNEAIYTIHDMKGKAKGQGSIHGKTKQVDISTLEPGMYAIQIVDMEGNILSSKKIVKN